MAGRISMGARREITAAVVDRYRSAGRPDNGRKSYAGKWVMTG
jgi:hypothetical protein